MIFMYDDYGATKTCGAFDFISDYSGREFAMYFVGGWNETTNNMGERHLQAIIYVGF